MIMWKWMIFLHHRILLHHEPKHLFTWQSYSLGFMGWHISKWKEYSGVLMNIPSNRYSTLVFVRPFRYGGQSSLSQLTSTRGHLYALMSSIMLMNHEVAVQIHFCWFLNGQRHLCDNDALGFWMRAGVHVALCLQAWHLDKGNFGGSHTRYVDTSYKTGNPYCFWWRSNLSWRHLRSKC